MSERKSENGIDPFLERAREFHSEGLDWLQSWGRAWIEERIKSWPSKWGDDLEVLIYGDFHKPPTEVFEVKELGITVYPEKLTKTVIRDAMCVLKAKVKINAKTVECLLDAARRINVLLGAWALVEWGNGHADWWSYVTHGTGGGVGTVLDHKDLKLTITSVLRLKPEIRKKIDSALYWVRSSRNLLMDFYRSDLLRTYVAYWNAFECLVDAICAIKPQKKMAKNEKRAAISKYLAEKAGNYEPSDIEFCYMNYVNPGFVGKASHALQVCFGQGGKHYIEECFRKSPKRDRLYDIRNAINHGDIDAENQTELLRVESRLHKLFMMIWGIFGRIVTFPCPVDRDLGIYTPQEANKANATDA